MSSVEQLSDPDYQDFKRRYGWESYGQLWEFELLLRQKNGFVMRSDLDIVAKSLGMTLDEIMRLVDRACKARILRRTRSRILSDEIMKDVESYNKKCSNLKKGNVRSDSGSDSGSGTEPRITVGILYNNKKTVIEFPAPIATAECRAAWEKWLAYKRDRGERYKSPMSVKAKLTSLSKLGPARMIAAIDWSIEQNYQGIYEERKVFPAPGRQPPPTAAPTRVQPKEARMPWEEPGFKPATESVEDVRQMINRSFKRSA